MLHPKFSTVLFSISYWMLAGLYLVFIRYFGLGEFAPPDLDLAEVIGYAGVVGLGIGLLFGIFPLNFILRLKRRRSFISILIIGTSCYIFFFAAVIFVSSSFGNSIQFALRYVISPDGLIVLCHLSMSSALYHFILQINKKFGPGILLEYSLGKYFSPKVEDRAFMFLDLKSSTRLAETLEHVSYSSLIQECYAELTEPLLTYKAQVYQYVGDEVVLTWRMNESFNPSYCHEFFFAFQQRLEAKRGYFMQLYGACPQFKAGVHCGRVTVAEVGDIKTEIAYHGDVLNTASRIQSLCNQLQQELLVSEALVRIIPVTLHPRVIFIDQVELRGKEAMMNLYTIEV